MSMINLILGVVTAAVLLVAQPGFAAENDTVLKGRIIRALSVDPQNANHILVGNKAKKPGSALVFQSLDGGVSWKTLNSGKSLLPEAADVQSVIAVSSERILAGTWKFGLFVSRDGGNSFSKIKAFPSNDIRDLQTWRGDGQTLVYAATAQHGIFASRDLGETWQPLGPNKDFYWSLSVSNRHDVYAVSPGKGIYCRCSGDDGWVRIFKADGAYGLAVSKSGAGRAIAGAKGGYFAADKQASFTKIAGLEGEKLADTAFAGKAGGESLLLASWANGIIVADPATGKVQRRLLKGVPVVHLAIAGNRLLAGTWGQGLKIIPLKAVAAQLNKEARDIPLIAATLDGDLAKVSQLIAAGVDIDETDKFRNTALIFAARDGHADIARVLLEAGADPGWIDSELVTPLILASFKNHIEIVRMLLERNVDREQIDQWGRKAITYALRRGSDDPIAVLLQQK